MCVLILAFILFFWVLSTRDHSQPGAVNYTTDFETMKPTPSPPMAYICLTILNETTYENMSTGLD